MPRKKKSTANKISESAPGYRSQMFVAKGANMDGIQMRSGSWNNDKKHSYRRYADQVISLSPGNVIRNQFFSGDGTDPVKSLHRLQEIFKGKLEKDVVQLVFSECGYNVDQALETLFMLIPEKELPRQNDHDWQSQQPTTSTASADTPRPQSFKYCGTKPGLRGGGHNGLPMRHFESFSGSTKSNWNTISVSSDSSSDCASLKDFDSSGSRRIHVNQPQFADVIYHKSDRDRSAYSSNSSVNNMTNSVPSNLSATGFSFSVNSESKSVDNIISSKNAIADTINLILSFNKVLIILRGLPGSGKTTLARQLKYNGVLFSTDDYFIRNNVYRFEPYLLTEAHEWNKARAHSALEDSVSPVIIDNTNIESWQIKPYVMNGIKFNYKIVILEPNTLWKFNVSELARRNTHGVTKEKISRMLERYEHGITVESFGLGYTQTNSLSCNANVSSPVSTILESVNESLTYEGISSTARLSPQNLIEAPKIQSPRSSTPDLKNKLSDTSSKTSISSENVENSSNSSQASEGLRSQDTRKLDLADLMALVQQESEDSLSISRRTSASSSQDTSGWEYDEEFLWSGDENRIHSRHSVSSGNNLLSELALDEEGAVLGQKASGKKSLETEQSFFKWNAPKPNPNSGQFLKVPNSHQSSEWLIPTYPVTKEVVSKDNHEQSSSKSSPSSCSSDWQIPNFPMTDKPAQSDFHNGSALIASSSSSTQTTNSDFVDLFTVCHSDSAADTKSFASKVLIGHVKPAKKCKEQSTVWPPRLTISVTPVFDKSTMTDDLEAELDRDKKLNILQSMFPLISLPDLEDILDKCHGDQDWAVNLLIDFGQEFNNKDCKMPVLPDDSPSVCAQEITPPKDSEVCEDSNSTNQEDSSASKAGNTSKTPDISCDRLVLSLEPAFAMQLEELFGTVGFHVSPECLSSEDLQVTLDMSLARQIHTLWRDTLCRKFSSNQSDSEDAVQGGIKQPVSNGGAPAAFSCSGTQDVPSLAAIMSMEAALEAKRQEMMKSPANNNTVDAMATKLGRIKLYSFFPGIDRAALDEMYQLNNYKLSLTLLCLREALGDGANGGLWLTPEMMEQTEEELCALAKAASMDGQLDPDWTTWVADLNEEEEAFVQQGTVQPVSNYDDLRAEANLHYRQRQECTRRSVEAYQRGMKAVAAFYAQRGRLHLQKLKEANQRASKKVLELRNQSMDPNCLDLHGLYVSEAQEALQNFLEERKCELQKSSLNRLVLSVITGRGLHSPNALGPKLKPAVLDFLQRENYRFDATQEGLVKIILT